MFQLSKDAVELLTTNNSKAKNELSTENSRILLLPLRVISPRQKLIHCCRRRCSCTDLVANTTESTTTKTKTKTAKTDGRPWHLLWVWEEDFVCSPAKAARCADLSS